jgi:hypothetical protein
MDNTEKKYCQILRNFIDKQYWFHICHRFWTHVQNFDIGQIQFESKFKITNFQYHSYLLSFEVYLNF